VEFNPRRGQLPHPVLVDANGDVWDTGSGVSTYSRIPKEDGEVLVVGFMLRSKRFYFFARTFSEIRKKG
jgi:hypothetical protein